MADSNAPVPATRVRRVFARWWNGRRAGLLHDAALRLCFWFHSVNQGNLLRLEGRLPAVSNAGTIYVGDRVAFRSPYHRVELFTAYAGRLSIGADSFLNQGCTLSASQLIEIGERCLIGEFVAIHDSNFHLLQPGEPVRTVPVRIGRNVWIGHRAVILAGVTIGDHAVIGAGAVVSRDVPARTVVAGVPAKPIRTVQCDDGWRRP